MSKGEHLAFAWLSLVFVVVFAGVAFMSYRDGAYFATALCVAVFPVAVAISYGMCLDLHRAIKARRR